MKKQLSLIAASLILPLALFSANAFLGYTFPAGGQRNSTVRVIVGGQGIHKGAKLITSTPGITLKSVSAVPRFGYFHTVQRKWLTQYLKNVYGYGKKDDPVQPPLPQEKIAKEWKNHPWLENLHRLPLLERSIVAESLFVRPNALQATPSLNQRLLLELEIAPFAPVGPCRIRLACGRNITNEKTFFIEDADQIQEVPYYPPFAKKPQLPVIKSIPVTLNGQIMPGETDEYRIHLEKGIPYTFTMVASELSPFLGDTVPGHFQGILLLRDADGKEAAFADDEYHHPDPVLRFTPQKSGVYTLQVSDSLKRGRVDFVYRVAVTGGTAPFIPYKNVSDYRAAAVQKKVDELPDVIPGNLFTHGLDIVGTLKSSRQTQSFFFTAQKGEKLVFELYGARLDSPLDGVLTLLAADGKVIAHNDDISHPVNFDLNRRQVDPLLNVTIPENGIYQLVLYDRCKNGSPDFRYILQIRHPQPEVIVISNTSTLNFNKNLKTEIKFFLIRKDGFEGAVTIHSPLTGDAKLVIPEKSIEAEFTLQQKSAPARLQPETAVFHADYSTDGGKSFNQTRVIPADEAMQAFAYTHLVTAERFCVFTMPLPKPVPAVKKQPPVPANKAVPAKTLSGSIPAK
ncbi:MAG: hypothetical protein E7057_10515 [Lentisphaerae bacterium]|nr:hypothetical protein [Lentisphaerota bacterium]